MRLTQLLLCYGKIKMKKFSEYLKESQDEEYVMQALADHDINSLVKGNKVSVSKDDIIETKSILKKLKLNMQVIGNL